MLECAHPVWSGGLETGTGSYIVITEGDGDSDDGSVLDDSFNDDILAPWQGFFVEREAPGVDASDDGGPQRLTFPASSLVDGPSRIIGGKAARATPGDAGRIGFVLTATDAQGAVLARDYAARLTLRPSALVGYDVLGRRVATLLDGELPANETKRLRFTGRGLASGVYFVRAVGERFTGTRRVTIVR